MRYLAIVALIALAACASAEAPAGAQSSQSSQPAPNYQDARSTASDAEVRDARRAYRAACQQSRSDAHCECMTGGMAQALTPAELAIATAAFTGRSVQATDAAQSRVAAVRQEVEPGCAQFR